MRLTALLALCSCLALAAEAQGPSLPPITMVVGTSSDGRATDQWLAILRRRLAPSTYDSVAALLRLPQPEERAWEVLIAHRTLQWQSEIPKLVDLFPGLRPAPVWIVTGNRGAEDAFTHDSLTIGFDLSALARVYGGSTSSENTDRLDRFFRHELVHTLQKRWLVRHPFPATTPLERALLDTWLEGLGNFYSLSPRWSPTADGAPSASTQQALARLQPRFVDRMTRLACTDSASATNLLADLSAGPFDQKWGALPVALWLLADLTRDSKALHTFVTAGPNGVWALAQRHLPSGLGADLAEAQRQSTRCP